MNSTFEWFKSIQKQDSRVKAIKANMLFNWSKLNNFGISHSTGEVCIFLNNDTEVITNDWIERLCENALREDIGIVGSLLLYEDKTIQHVGVVVGINGWADHVFEGIEQVHYMNPFISPMVNRNVLAVMGACMAISKNTLQKICNCDARILVEDTIDLSNKVTLDGYILVDCESEYTFHKQTVSTAERIDKTLPVHENDVFVATAWWTAYTISTVIKWQSTVYNRKDNPLIYFIHDYEPGFHARSSRYLMADSTYKLDIPTFAIFNSTLLKEFFDRNSYNFEKVWSFDPSLDEKLSNHLKNLPNSIQKKKQIFVYGRHLMSQEMLLK